LEKHSTNSKKNLKLTVTLLLLSILTVSAAATVAPTAMASETCTITLTPNSGVAGTAVNVIGFGFVANQAVTIKFSGTQVKQCVSSSTGTITTSFFVPTNMNFGTYTVIASDNVVSASATFVIQPQADQTVQLIPTLGAVGSTVKVIGYGFNSGSQISLKFGGTELLRDTSNSSGSVTISFTIPTMAAGTYSVSVTDKAGNTAAANYQITTRPQTSVSSQQPTTSSTPSASNPWINPYVTATSYSYPPITPKGDEGSLSPLIIGLIIAAIVAVIIPVTFFVRRRGGGRELTYEQESTSAPIAPPPSYMPRGPTASTGPTAAPARNSISTRFDMFDQPTARSTTGARYGQTPTYGQSAPRSYGAAASSRPGMASRSGPAPAATRVCPRCRQSVREDYSVCPHCNKRLR
jgi:hypothetical protein